MISKTQYQIIIKSMKRSLKLTNRQRNVKIQINNYEIYIMVCCQVYEVDYIRTLNHTLSNLVTKYTKIHNST